MSKNRIVNLFILYAVIIFLVTTAMELHNIPPFDILSPIVYHLTGILVLALVFLFGLFRAKREVSDYYEESNRELVNTKVALEASNQELEAANQESQAITEQLRLANDELEWQKQDLDYLVQAIPEGIIRTDVKGKVTYFNQRLLEQTGLSQKAVQDKDIKNIVLAEDRAFFAESFQKIFNKFSIKELPFRSSQGDQMVMDMTLLKDAKGLAVGTLGILRDFTKTGKIIEELDNSKKELKQKIEEMQLMHKVTIDREKRIIQLKEEIEKLKVQLAKTKEKQA
jgi:PAS domain S-box-containing protein